MDQDEIDRLYARAEEADRLLSKLQKDFHCVKSALASTEQRAHDTQQQQQQQQLLRPGRYGLCLSPSLIILLSYSLGHCTYYVPYSVVRVHQSGALALRRVDCVFDGS